MYAASNSLLAVLQSHYSLLYQVTISRSFFHVIKHPPIRAKHRLPSILLSYRQCIVRILQANCLAEHAVARPSCLVSCATLGASRSLNPIQERQN